MENQLKSLDSVLRIAITPGEPAGIGPELIAMLAQQAQPHELVIFADPNLLQQRARQLGFDDLKVRLFQPDQVPQTLKPGEICVAPTPLSVDAKPGELNRSNANYVLKTLTAATQSCLQQQCAALITGPVHKGIINDNGVAFSGHTEFFAELSNCDRVVMMLATKGLKVALATTHLPLRDIADTITQELLKEIIQILRTDLQLKFGIDQPRILVAGLNPHAGEGGHLGREEIDIIEPVLNQFRQQGYDLVGPLPADTLFTDQYLNSADAVLAMFHDQGLPVLKFKGFGRAANITLGLPFIRTSVDHGTALDLAGTGSANLGSLQTALDYAIEMAQNRKTA